jgi:hypothetical protein
MHGRIQRGAVTCQAETRRLPVCETCSVLIITSDIARRIFMAFMASLHVTCLVLLLSQAAFAASLTSCKDFSQSERHWIRNMALSRANEKNSG